MLYFNRQFEKQEFEKGKLQVIEGRKAVRPDGSWDWQVAENSGVNIPGKVYLGFF
jgi:hypothetical protein